jgi:hypothetical protein
MISIPEKQRKPLREEVECKGIELSIGDTVKVSVKPLCGRAEFYGRKGARIGYGDRVCPGWIGRAVGELLGKKKYPGKVNSPL